MVFGDPIVNHTGAPAFAVTLGSPTELTAATGTGDDIARVRLFHKVKLDCENLIVTKKPEGLFGEIGIFFKCHTDSMARGLTSSKRKSHT